jgi:hypothetical protein
MFDTPILFIFFNRLETTARVLDAILQTRPSTLYLFCDAARSYIPGEKELIEDTRQWVVRHIEESTSSSCRVIPLFEEENLGPGKGIGKAIQWFFNQVDEGIVLEHDCLPHPDFFEFCRSLLLHYRHDPEVLFISGSHYANDVEPEPNTPSYGFNALSHIWGWASWKRVMKDYDYHLNLSEQEMNHLIKTHQLMKDKSLIRYILYSAWLHRHQLVDSWDMQLLQMVWQKGGLCIHPSRNLISNIGFGEFAVHCRNPLDPIANLPTYSVLPMIFTDQKIINYSCDEEYYNRFRKRPVLWYAYKYLRSFWKTTVSKWWEPRYKGLPT